jgi:hypothetical protein
MADCVSDYCDLARCEVFRSVKIETDKAFYTNGVSSPTVLQQSQGPFFPALYVGIEIFPQPTLFLRLRKERRYLWCLANAGGGQWSGNSLNLDQFERHEALLRLNLHF